MMAYPTRMVFRFSPFVADAHGAHSARAWSTTVAGAMSPDGRSGSTRDGMTTTTGAGRAAVGGRTPATNGVPTASEAATASAPGMGIPARLAARGVVTFATLL